MALVNFIEKKARMSLDEIVRFQIMIHCYLKDLPISAADLKCFSMLAIAGEVELPEFCVQVSVSGVFKNPQSVRNCIARAEHMGIVTKIGKGRKKIMINPELQIQTKGNIVLDTKAFHVAQETI